MRFEPPDEEPDFGDTAGGPEPAPEPEPEPRRKKPRNKADAACHPHTRPALSAECERVRLLWVRAVRAYHEARTGEPCRYESRAAWDGGVDPNSKKQYKTPLWPKVVAAARAAGLDPEVLVRALFVGWSGDSVPSPSWLGGPTNVKAARHLLARRRGDLALAVRREEAVFRAASWSAGRSIVDPAEAVRFVLMDQGLDLSPLFRHCCARLRGLPEVAFAWEPAARAQLLSDPASYLAAWAPLLPDDLAGAARTAAAPAA